MQDKNDVWEKYKDAILAKLTASEVYGDIKNQKEGTDGWVNGLCPFHNDTHNSFAYNRNTLAWVCFSPTCGKGSLFDFLMLKSGRNFKETLFELGNKLGVKLPGALTTEKLLQKIIKKEDKDKYFPVLKKHLT